MKPAIIDPFSTSIHPPSANLVILPPPFQQVKVKEDLVVPAEAMSVQCDMEHTTPPPPAQPRQAGRRATRGRAKKRKSEDETSNDVSLYTLHTLKFHDCFCFSVSYKDEAIVTVSF